MNLVLLEHGETGADGLARLAGRRAAHVQGVLGARAGDEIVVGELGGQVGRARVVSLGSGEVTLAVTLSAPPPAPIGIDLLLALPRPKSLRRLLRAVTSMGVKRIVLVNAARVEKSYFASPLLAPGSIAEDLRDGLEQARDTMLPEVRIEPLFRPFVEDRAPSLWPADVEKRVAHPALEPTAAELAPAARVVVAIGPDGGWVQFELDLLAASGFRPFSLGPRPLRVDVATVAALTRLDFARQRTEGAHTNSSA